MGHYLGEVNKNVHSKLKVHKMLLKFTLKLNIEKWGSYVKGDEKIFYVDLLDEQNGLVRYPIDKRWDIIKCEIENEELWKSE